MTKQDMTMLQAYGWNEHWSLMAGQIPQQDKALVPARITAQFSKQYRIITQEGEQSAIVTGKYEYEAASKSDFPAVGDWVMVEPLQGNPVPSFISCSPKVRDDAQGSRKHPG